MDKSIVSPFFDSWCRCIVSIKVEKEVICALLNADIAGDLG